MRVALHLVESRRESLRELIRIDGFLPIGEICRRLKISEATARRDLAVVAGKGQITRTRGGALADYNAGFASHGERASRARTSKGRIAAQALKCIPDRATLFLDAGTTIQVVARALLKRGAERLVVVTNSLAVATLLGGAKGMELHLLGGVYLHRQAVLLGEEAVESLKRWRFDAAFLGGEGMDPQGVSNSHEEIAEFQREVLQRSHASYFCLDATKVGKTTPFRVTSWEGSQAVSLITDASAKQLERAGIHLPATTLLQA